MAPPWSFLRKLPKALEAFPWLFRFQSLLRRGSSLDMVTPDENAIEPMTAKVLAISSRRARSFRVVHGSCNKKQKKVQSGKKKLGPPPRPFRLCRSPAEGRAGV